MPRRCTATSLRKSRVYSTLEIADKGLVNGKLFFFEKKIIFRLLNLRAKHSYAIYQNPLNTDDS